MKLTIERTALHKALGAVKGAIEKRTTIPILANVLLDAADNRLTLLGTDLDLAFSTKVSAEVETGGRITVDANTLRQIVSKFDAKSHVVLEQKDDKLNVRAGRARFSLNTLPADDFPSLDGPVGEGLSQFSVPAKELARLFGKAQFSISTEETRYYLNGVYFHAPTMGPGANEKRPLRAVATDGHRLAWLETDLPDGAEQMEGVIVPRKTVAEVLGLIGDDEEGSVEVSATRTKIEFAKGDSVITSKLIDGTFPDYMRVVPLGNDKKAKVDLLDLTAAADRVTTISSERGRAVKLSWAAGKVTLSVSNPDAGAAQEELDAEYDSDRLEIGFNARYLHDILLQVEDEAVEISLADPGSPTLFRGPSDSRATYVLMPMRV